MDNFINGIKNKCDFIKENVPNFILTTIYYGAVPVILTLGSYKY